MTNNTHSTYSYHTGNIGIADGTRAHSSGHDGLVTRITRVPRQISPVLAALAGASAAAGIVTGYYSYLHRSPVHHAPVPGTSAWTPHLIEAAVLGMLYGIALWRRGRGSGPGSARLLLLAPLGRSAAARLSATLAAGLGRSSWRALAALGPLALIGYSFWRAGEQVTGGLDPNFTVNAWGGPSYLGAMACHYLDLVLMIAVAAWLLSKILLHATDGRIPPRAVA